MSTYSSLDVPEPDGSLFFDIAWDCFGNGTPLILDGKACYSTAEEAREIARAFVTAADLADEALTEALR